MEGLQSLFSMFQIQEEINDALIDIRKTKNLKDLSFEEIFVKVKSIVEPTIEEKEFKKMVKDSVELYKKWKFLGF